MSLNLGAMVLNSPEVQAILATGIPPVPAPTLLTEADEGDLRRMMRDPRYWRSREPEFVARVTDKFRKLVGCA